MGCAPYLREMATKYAQLKLEHEELLWEKQRLENQKRVKTLTEKCLQTIERLKHL